MGVKREHTHADGHICYSIQDRNGHKLSKPARVFLNGREFTVAYMNYAGHWYAFDPESGREIGNFTSQLYEEFIAPYAEELVSDPDCLVAAST